LTDTASALLETPTNEKSKSIKVFSINGMGLFGASGSAFIFYRNSFLLFSAYSLVGTLVAVLLTIILDVSGFLLID